jgi:hypothetical protein
MTTTGFRRLAIVSTFVVTALSVHAGTFTVEQVPSSPFPTGATQTSSHDT